MLAVKLAPCILMTSDMTAGKFKMSLRKRAAWRGHNSDTLACNARVFAIDTVAQKMDANLMLQRSKHGLQRHAVM